MASLAGLVVAGYLIDDENRGNFPCTDPELPMAKNLFMFSCPCCNKMVEVDTRSGKARAVRADEQKGGQSLDDLLDADKHNSDRLGDMFSSAKDSENKRDDQLDKQLRRAKKEAQKDKNDKPRNIFDLD
ncbi:MAG: hypothetical protein ACI89X_001574 [Planctomycetota bacterium]